MNRLHLSYKPVVEGKTITLALPPSKSIEARRLILASLEGSPISIDDLGRDNLPTDLLVLTQALTSLHRGDEIVDVGESGTAMRFMLAQLTARTKRTVQLEGRGRQYERPIAPLVDALRQLGGDISYLGKEGYPPLLIKPSKLKAQTVQLDASQSSQYLSALLLIAPLVEGDGYRIDTSEYGLSSLPYALVTIKEMRDKGYNWQQNGLFFSYLNTSIARVSCSSLVEADWSAASYAYLLMCLLDRDLVGYTSELLLPGLYKNSTQGDRTVLIELYEGLGILTRCEGYNTSLSLSEEKRKSHITLNCRNTPDLVPALVASMIARDRSFYLYGVAHLRLKESDRLEALRSELDKIGVALSLSSDSIAWDGTYRTKDWQRDPLILNPYHDHRIAMALAPLMARLSPHGVIVCDADCVDKSYPSYWREITKLGYITKTL